MVGVHPDFVTMNDTICNQVETVGGAPDVMWH